MGNVMENLARPAFGGPPRIPKDNSWTGVTWVDFISSRVPRHDVPVDNGYNFIGYEIPEPALEAILCRLPTDEILKCNYVCRAWKDLLTRKSFWKKAFDFRGLDWNKVPNGIREKPEGWMVLYAQFRHKTFSKNYINKTNQLESWNIYQNGGNGWAVEPEPVGCEPLPENPFFGLDDRSCFVSSYLWASKYATIDLWEAGFNPVIMRISLPFEIKCSQMYSARFDCGGIFKWELRLLDSSQKILREYKPVEFERPPSSNWNTVEHSFKFKSSHADFIKDIRYVVFIHEGKDSQFWSGHYGIKLARACVTVHCLETDPEESEHEAFDTGNSGNDDEDSASDIGGEFRNN